MISPGQVAIWMVNQCVDDTRNISLFIGKHKLLYMALVSASKEDPSWSLGMGGLRKKLLAIYLCHGLI